MKRSGNAHLVATGFPDNCALHYHGFQPKVVATQQLHSYGSQ
jgi:hypothetical protein